MLISLLNLKFEEYSKNHQKSLKTKGGLFFEAIFSDHQYKHDSKSNLYKEKYLNLVEQHLETLQKIIELQDELISLKEASVSQIKYSVPNYPH